MAGPQGTSTRRSLHESLSAMIEAERADMFITLRGKVVSYDIANQTAEIKPLLKQRFGDQMLEAPNLQAVHVRFPRAGGNIVHTPLQAGDFVTLHFDQRSTEDYDAEGGTPLDNERARMNGLSDCIAVPGCYPVSMPSKGLPKDGTYYGAEGGKNGLTVTKSPSKSNPAGKKITIGSGVKPDAATHELNEQLKGLRADLSQVKDSHHALFDVVSKLRTNAESVIPALGPINAATQVAAALNGAASGLDTMKTLAEGKLQGFFQNALKDALKGFLDPSRLLSAASLIAGNPEALMAALEAQIADLAANNPVVGTMDDIAQRLEDLGSPEGLAAEVQEEIGALQGRLSSLISGNPVLGKVLDLRKQLSAIADTAGPAINFLEPQKRLVQGITKSMRFGGPG